MQVAINTRISDKETWHIVQALHTPFKAISDRLSMEYGGIMEHLWIDIELLESFSGQDGKSRYPFRFQKRVSGRSHFGLPDTPDKFNVGHYSVRPDFNLIKLLPDEKLVSYVLTLIYESTEIFFEKKKKLDGFNIELFRSTFLLVSKELGYEISTRTL